MTILEEWSAPEGGIRAWLTVVYTFLANAVVFGTLNCFAIFYVSLVNRSETDADVSTTVALVGSLAIGFHFLMTPISVMLVDLVGHRTIAIIGGLISSLGLFLSSFLIDYPGALCLTFGVMFGGGGSLQIVSGISCTSLYFKKKVGLVTALSISGGAILGAVLPPIIRYFELRFGLEGMFQILAAAMAVVPFAAIVLQTPEEMPLKVHDPMMWNKNLIYMENWKNRKYIILCISLAFALFGFSIPYVHIVKYCEQIFPNENGDLLITCLNVASIVSRLSLGALGDVPEISSIVLLQMSVILSGVVILLLTLSPNFIFLVVLTLILGLTDGGYVTLMRPLALHTCGDEGGAQAIGFLQGIAALPIIAGPPLAGWIHDVTQSYTVPFLIAGGATVVGGTIISAMYFVRAEVPEDPDDGELTIFDRQTPYYDTYEDISKILVH